MMIIYIYSIPFHSIPSSWILVTNPFIPLPSLNNSLSLFLLLLLPLCIVQLIFMCSDRCSISSSIPMSNPSDHDQLLIVKENKEEFELNFSKRPKLEFQEKCRREAITLQDPPEGVKGDQQDVKQEAFFEDVLDSSVVESNNERPSLGALKASDADEEEEEEDDGFKTPTSLDHRIPVITQCPHAPRKSTEFLLSKKRKASPPNARRSLQLDLSQEVEALFPRPIRADLHKKMKKARSEDNDTPQSMNYT